MSSTPNLTATSTPLPFGQNAQPADARAALAGVPSATQQEERMILLIGFDGVKDRFYKGLSIA